MKIRSRSHPSGAIRFGCLGYLFVIVMLWSGGQGLYVALKNREPLEISVKDYIATKPDAEWITLQEASLNLLEAAHRERRGEIKEVYIPLRPKNQQPNELVHALLLTKDKSIIAKVEHLKHLAASPTSQTPVAQKQLSQSQIIGSFSGLIQIGIDSRSDTRDQLVGLNMKLAKGFVILEENKTPEMTLSLVMLGIGLVLVIGIILEARRGRAGQTPPNLPEA